MIETGKIYNESCLDTLARMPDNYLDCVVTSPPYYGLRVYNTEPQIWGGDKNCSHIWGDTLPYAKQDNRTPEQKASQGAAVSSNIRTIEFAVGNSGSYCHGCGAWRGELGLEPTFQLYISHLIDIFREVKRVLKPTGTCWVNLGDSYANYKDCKSVAQTLAKGTGNEQAHVIEKGFSVTRNARMLRLQGMPNKSLMNIPHRFAIAMTDELGFVNRNQIIWHKPACLPSSAKDRFTVDFESIFFFTKSPKYYFEQQLEPYQSTPSKPRDKAAEKYEGTQLFSTGARDYYSQGGRNMRTTWTVNFEPQKVKHFASYPTKLIETPIKAGCPENGIVYDPFVGTGTTLLVAERLGRRWIGSELLPDYYKIAAERLGLNQMRITA